MRDKHALWKWLFLFVLVVGSLSTALPLKDKVQLGIDLRGGTSFLVEINEQDLLQKLRSEDPDEWMNLTPEKEEEQLRERLQGAQERSLEVLRNRVDSLGIAEPVIYPEKHNRIVIQLPGIDDAKRKEAEEAIQRAAFLAFRLVHVDDDTLMKELLDSGAAPEGYEIVAYGERRFYRRTAEALPTGEEYKAYRRRMLRFHAPAGYDFMLEKRKMGNETLYSPHFVERRIQLTGQYVSSAHVQYMDLGQPAVGLSFTSEGARKFGDLTRDYSPRGARNDAERGRLLGIVLDGTLYSAPQLIQPIYEGRAQITGQFTFDESNFLANILRSGSLPISMDIAETRTVSPTLGEDSINSGIRSVLYGGTLVVIFMGAYYLLAGLVANMALLLNLILLPLGAILAAGFLGLFAKDVVSGGAIALPVLTLPGIAGILLTIGMAVDANVLIYERIREEQRLGKRRWAAVVGGYDRAFSTILDSNVTTFITGVILFIFGSGPIRGFAVMLCAGLLVSMFTALVFTRMAFHAILSKATKLGSIRMLSLFGLTSFDFLRGRKPAIALSVVVIVATWGLLIARGIQDPTRVFGVDFTGGASLTFQVNDEADRPSIEGVRSALQARGMTGLQIQYQEDSGRGHTYLVVKSALNPDAELSPSKIADQVLNASHAGSFTLVQEDDVGPQVGRELKGRAVKAVLLSLLGIIIYVTIRFEFGFALGAIVALVHDVLITVGLFHLFGLQLSLTVVAAVLTIVGYSVNDTIVIFDRIREDLRSERQKSFAEICNLSMNQTLSRTILTSLTTLIVVGMMLLVGGGAMYDFALTLFIGIVAGVYSTMFIATPVVLAWHRGKKPEMNVKVVQAA